MFESTERNPKTNLFENYQFNAEIKHRNIRADEELLLTEKRKDFGRKENSTFKQYLSFEMENSFILRDTAKINVKYVSRKFQLNEVDIWYSEIHEWGFQ